MTQLHCARKSLAFWFPLHRVKEVLTYFNYIIEKVRTNYTQSVRRIQLRPVIPQTRVDELTVIKIEKFQCDSSFSRFGGDQRSLRKAFFPRFYLTPERLDYKMWRRIRHL